MCVIIITHNTNSELILIETKAKQWTEKPALKKQTAKLYPLFSFLGYWWASRS